MSDNNKEKVYIGKHYRFIVEQTIGPKFLDRVREKYSVKELRGDGEIIFLIEENENEE